MKDDQHDRTDLSLKPARHAQTADNHEDSRNETENGALGKQNARGLHRIRQRRTLLRPLIKNRQPKMIRRTASAINTRDE
jgi:hypothetical protein